MSVRSELSVSEYRHRGDQMRVYMEEQGLAGLCIFGAMRIFYLSGFHHLATERPVVLVLPLEGDLALLVPHLEEENIPLRTPHIEEVRVYREYPGTEHPMHHLAGLLRNKGLAEAALGVDAGGWGGGWGYRGPELGEVVPKARLTNVRDVIDDRRMIKSPAEVELIRRSVEFGNVAHSLLQDYTEPGLSELAISMRAAADASLHMTRVLGPDWEPMGSAAASAGITSGFKTALNHRRPGSRRIRRGDVILTYASAEVGGYVSELERMFIVGPPSERQRTYFDLEVQAQDVALASIRPGIPCSEVERAVNAFLEEHDLYPLTRTHIGHGIGIEGHEAPFLDLGDDTLIEPGMVLTVEPCLFLPGEAGFRHSDTVLVTEEGCELLTYYPRDIDSLTVDI